MTEAQKSLKQQLRNNGLWVDDSTGEPILRDGKNRIISGGGGGTIVIPSSTEKQGAPIAHSLNIDGNDWNMPEGGEGGTEVVPSTERAEGAPTLGSLRIDDNEWNVPEGGEGGTEVIPSVERVTGADTLGSLEIDGTDWNIPTGGSEYPIIDAELRVVSQTEFEGNIGVDGFNVLKQGKTRLRGTLDMRDLGGDLWTLYSTDISTAEDGKGGLRLCGMLATSYGTLGDFNINEHGEITAYMRTVTGSDVTIYEQEITGKPTAKAIVVDGEIWNFPEGGSGGTVKWGDIEGDINEQDDLKSVTDNLSSRISTAQSKADSAKSRADSAHDLAAGAVTEASAAAAGVAELEYRVEGTIAPAVTALQGEMVDVQAGLLNKVPRGEFTNLENRVSTLESELRDVKSRLDDHNGKINQINTRIDELWQFIDTEVKTRFVFTGQEE